MKTRDDIRMALRQLHEAYAVLGIDVGDLEVEAHSPGDGRTRYTVVNGAGQQPLGRRVYRGAGECYDHIWTAVDALRWVDWVRRKEVDHVH